MSSYLFEEAKMDDLLRIEGPHGGFFLRNDKSNNIVFLATGTGIAPILSILKSPENLEILKDRNVFLFHGAKTQAHLIEYDYLSTMDIAYFPTLSMEERKPFFSGYIQNCLLEQEINLEDTTVYACGNERMILQSRLILTANGLKSENFYSDAFLESN